MAVIRRISLYIQSGFYLFAGINHFTNPAFYNGLIPNYLPFHGAINAVAGVVEIIFGVGFMFQETRKWASYGIILMLLAFVPSHVWFIQLGGCVENGLCAPPWLGWVRLVIVHPLLIWWAWAHRR